MPRRSCEKHGDSQPCTCAMGNLYRFVEPVILLLLKRKGRSYGYDLAAELAEHAMTDADIERAALYRTLRQLEEYGNVVSEWEGEAGGRARRVYRLTPAGEVHLQEWVTVLEQVSRSMARFVRNGKRAIAAAPKKTALVPAVRAQKRVKAL